MKSIFRVISCVVLISCSMHVFADMRVLGKTLYCKVYSTSKFPISKSLELEYYEAGKVLVEEHSTYTGILLSTITKYKSIDPREVLVNKCSERVGYLTKEQKSALEFYVWKRSYSYTSTGYFKLEIDDYAEKEPIKVETTPEPEHSIKEIAEVLETPVEQVNKSKHEETMYKSLETPLGQCNEHKDDESIYLDDDEITGDANLRRRVDNFLNSDIDMSTDISKLLYDSEENINIDTYQGDGVKRHIGDENDNKRQQYINIKEDEYQGDYKDGKRHGKGVLFSKTGEVYDGDFKEGKKDGAGQLLFPNGRRYVGDFKNDKYHGEGTMIYPDNSKYEGMFEKGKKHGKARVSYADGSIYEGMFYKGRRHGDAILVNPDGSKYKIRFENGKKCSKKTALKLESDLPLL